MTDTPADLDDQSSVYKTLLESTRAIPWKIDWNTMRFAYIGPQIEALLGWTPESWATVEDWVTRMHPEDQAWVPNFCVSQSESGIDHEADYQALHKDGHYVWIRDVVHVVRNAQGDVEALIGFMFDISERKKTEQELTALQKKLEEYSFKDGLTGIANRRMFDNVLDDAWYQALRNSQPLSVILLDIDHFKQYNDLHGHLEGDDCLKRIATLLENTIKRSRDFVARFGGEEFVVILPETDAEAAVKIGQRFQDQLFREQLPHGAPEAGKWVTVSMGIGTITPTRDNAPRDFLNLIDQRLYDAKNAGRNKIVAG